MAVDFGDHASGFRHTEVIRFINNEVLLNGGGPGFYVAFRSRPWNEVEDRLRAVVADPQVPHAIKRACAWSALALSVRVGARQREQQECRVHWLQEQVEERETAAWALASELQRLCRERKEVAAQLRCAQAALQHVVDERNVEVTSESGAEQGGAAAWPGDMDEKSKMMATEAQAMHHLEARMAAPASAAAAPASAAAAPAATAAAPAAAAAVPAAAAAAPAAMLYVQALPSSWAQALQTSLPVQVPHPFPFSASFQMGFPYWAPLPHSVVVEADTAAATTTATAVPLQMPLMPPLGVYPPGQWAAEECSETFQGGCPLGDSRSQSQDEGPVCPQGKTSLEKFQSEGMSIDAPGEVPPGEQQEPQPRRSNSQLQEKPASGCSPKNWDCPWCKAMNFSWCTTCYQCKNCLLLKKPN
uniref:RanBP2-type domain-containing protein n=1 Tax=Mustela putorius furo TaxID=9669 RepID=M3XQI0_MUSPF